MKSPSFALFATLLALAVSPTRGAALRPDADDGGLSLPPGFRAIVIADGLNAGRSKGEAYDMIRHISVAPNGDVYAKTFRGGIIAMRDEEGDGRMDRFEEFGGGGGTHIQLRDGWLYHSTNSAILRYRREPGQLVPVGEPEVIVSGLLDRNTHNAKAFAFDDKGGLLVEIGAPYNVFIDPEGIDGPGIKTLQETQSGFWRFDANRLNQTLADGHHVSRGHRHAVAFAREPNSGSFYFVQMGRDQLNDVAPEFYDALDNAERISEELHRLVEGGDYGWPTTYYDPIKKARMLAPEYGGDGRKRVEAGRFPEPLVAFPAHWAPLQLTFYTGVQFPERYRGGAFVAFHGSWNRAPLPQEGYNISFVPFDKDGNPAGDFEVFARRAGGDKYRMGSVVMGPDESLYVSDTDVGRIWRVIYTGDAAPDVAVSAVNSDSASLPPQLTSKGGIVYQQFCASCHMPDGRGAGHLQPALAGSSVVGGDLPTLARVVLRGPAATLSPDRPKYGNVMPPFAMLTDVQISDLVAYLRTTFAGLDDRVSAEQISALRSN